MDNNDYEAYRIAGKHFNRTRYEPKNHLAVNVHPINSQEDRLVWERTFLRSYLIYRPFSEEEKLALAEVTGKPLIYRPFSVAQEKAFADILPENDPRKEQYYAEGIVTGGLSFKRHLVDTIMPIIREDFEHRDWPPALKDRLQEMKDVLDVSWKKIIDPADPTISLVAKPQNNEEFEKQLTLGITYATKVYDPIKGYNIGLIEGTYVPRQYRKRGIGTQLIEAVAEAQKGTDTGELLYWTHNNNPHTQNIYPNISIEKEDPGYKKAQQTSETMWVTPLTKRTMKQYVSILPKEQQKHYTMDKQCSAVNHLSNNNDYTAERTNNYESSEFKQLYQSMLIQENSDYTDEKFHELLKKLESGKVQAYIIRHKEGVKEQKPCGLTFLEEAIKFPRDPFLSVDITGVYLEREHQNMAAGYALLSSLKKDIIEENKHADTPTEAIRWVLKTNHPLESIMQVPTEITDSNDCAKPIAFPFKLFRLPITDQARDKLDTSPLPSKPDNGISRPHR